MEFQTLMEWGCHNLKFMYGSSTLFLIFKSAPLSVFLLIRWLKASQNFLFKSSRLWMLPFGSSLYQPIATLSRNLQNILHRNFCQFVKSIMFVTNLWIWSSGSDSPLYSRSLGLTHLYENFFIKRWGTKASSTMLDKESLIAWAWFWPLFWASLLGRIDCLHTSFSGPVLLKDCESKASGASFSPPPTSVATSGLHYWSLIKSTIYIAFFDDLPTNSVKDLTCSCKLLTKAMRAINNLSSFLFLFFLPPL